MLHCQDISVRILLDDILVLAEMASIIELAGESVFSLLCSGFVCVLHSRVVWVVRIIRIGDRKLKVMLKLITIGGMLGLYIR